MSTLFTILSATEQTQIRLHCLPCRLHYLDTLLYAKTTLFKFKDNYSDFFSCVRIFRIFYVTYDSVLQLHLLLPDSQSPGHRPSSCVYILNFYQASVCSDKAIESRSRLDTHASWDCTMMKDLQAMREKNHAKTCVIRRCTSEAQYELHHDKTNKMGVRPGKTQMSLGICPV